MKKIIIFIFMFTLCLFMVTPKVWALDDQGGAGGGPSTSKPQVDSTEYNRDDSFDNNCADIAKTLQIGGKLVFIVKIVLPLILIGKYTVELSKLVISGDQSQLGKTGKKIGVSIIAAIIIFYLPVIVNVAFGLVADYAGNESSDSKICSACILDPYSNTCTDHIK